MHTITAESAKTLSQRSLAKYGLPFLGIAVLFLVLVAYQIYAMRLTAKAAAVTNANNLALVLESKLNDEFAAAERTVSAMVAAMAPDAMRPEMAGRYRPAMTRWLKANVQYAPSASALRYYDAKGDWLYSSVDAEVPHNVGDRSHFQQIKATPAGSTVFSEVTLGRATGRISMYIAKAIRDSEGSFLGMASIAIDLTALHQHFRNIAVGTNGVLALRRLDNGASIVRFPGPVVVDNKPTPDLPVRYAILNNGPVGFMDIKSRIDGSQRIYGYRKIGAFPLFIAVGIADSDYLADWRSNSALLLLGALLFLAALATFFFWLTASESRRSRSETSLRESKDQFTKVVELSPLSMALVCADGTIEYINRKAIETFGYTHQDIPNMDRWWVQAYPDETYRAEVIALWMGLVTEALARKHEIEPREYRVSCKNGSVKMVAIFGVWIADKVLVIFEDITERKRAEQALARESHRNQVFLRNASDGVHILDADGNVLDASDSFCAMLGYSREEIIGANVSLWDAKWSPQELKRELAQQMAQEGPSLFETRHRRRDGSLLDVEVTGQSLELDGKPALFNSARDITERKRAQEALRESESRLSAVVQANPIGIIVRRVADGRILEANDAALRLYGYTRDEVIGNTIGELGAYANPAQRADVEQRLREQGGVDRFPIDFRNSRGEVGVMELSARIIELQGEQCVVAMMVEVTERKRLEEAHLQAQKLESLGTLTGGIAHDFNNILAAIRGNADLAAADVGPDHVAAQSLEEIRKASARASELVRRIMAFGRPREPQRKVVDLSAVVGEVLKLLRSTLPAGISLSKDFSGNTPHVLADAGQIHEAIVNLTTNAAYAIGPRAGSIEYRLEPVQMGEEFARGIPSLKAGRYVRLTVTDNGCGMDAATLERVFDAFYTTKPVGDGTGLGLSMVHGIMRSHGGAVTVQSTPGKGSSFALYFPAAKEKAQTEEQGAAAQSLLSPGRRVLYVDDEEPLVFLASRALSRLGHQLSGFTDPIKALETFRAHPQDFDVAVTDLSMPHMSGFELAHELLAVRPGIPVLMTSGYIGAEDEARARAAGIREVILKPATMDELGAVLDRLFRDGEPNGRPSA